MGTNYRNFRRLAVGVVAAVVVGVTGAGASAAVFAAPADAATHSHIVKGGDDSAKLVNGI